MPETTLAPRLQAVVVRSIRALSLVCDHAQARDAVGFSKATAGPGHEIAALGTERWTPDIWLYAGRLSAHHSRQLERANVISEEEVGALQHFANGGVRAPAIHSDWMDVADIDGRKMLIISIRSNRPLANILKTIRDEFKDDVYQPAGGGKLWRVAERFAFAVLPHVDDFERLDSGVDTFLAGSLSRATNEDRRLAHDGPVMRLNAQDKVLWFVQPYSGELRQLIEATKGGRWDIGKGWSQCRYSISLNEAGYRLFQAICEQLNVIVTEDAQEAILAAKNVPAPKISDLVSFEIKRDGERFQLLTSGYIEPWVNAFRTVPGRRYENGTWSIPASSICLEKLIEATADGETTAAIADAARALVLVMREEEERDPTRSQKVEVYPRLHVTGEGSVAYVGMTQYVGAWVSAIKSLPRKDRNWNGNAWKVKNDTDTFDLLVEAFDAIAHQTAFKDYGSAAVEELQRHRGLLVTTQMAAAPRR